MINIRPVSDLRNKFTDIEELVKEGEPVYLTKNALDAADYQAEHTDKRLEHEEVFGALRGKLNAR